MLNKYCIGMFACDSETFRMLQSWISDGITEYKNRVAQAFERFFLRKRIKLSLIIFFTSASE